MERRTGPLVNEKLSNYMARESNLQIRVEVNCEKYWSVEAVDMDNISLGGHTGKNGTESS